MITSPQTGTDSILGRFDRLSAGLGNPWIRCFLLVVIGFLVRMPALQGLPLWDDDYLITDNPFIKSPLLIPESFRHFLFPDVFSSHYRPVQNISFALDYLIWNTDPYGYHLTNLLLHLGSGVLLYFLLCKLFRDLTAARRSGEPESDAQRSTRTLCAFLVALLWIVHPVHSAAIDYISGRADSLAFLFACGGWLLFFQARKCAAPRHRVLFYGASVLCGILALCSREIAGIWLGLLLLHIFAFDKTSSRKVKLVALGCCLVLIAGYAALRHLPEVQGTPPKSQGSSASVRAVRMLRALGDYGRLMVYPSTLYMERTVLDPENYLTNQSWRKSVASEYLSLLGAGVFCVLLYGSCHKGHGQLFRIFGALWFSLGFLPISNLIELNANVAEHWLYLPSVGFLIFLGGCALELPANGRKLAVAFACVAVSLLGARGYVRSTDWVTPKTFYQRTINAGGSSTRVAANLGIIYSSEGEYARAEAIFRRILQLTPDYPIARNGLAEALYRQGKRAEGTAMFSASKVAATEARKDYPHTWIAALNLARSRHNEGHDDEALVILEQARKDYPDVWQILRFQTELLRKTSGPETALRELAPFVRDHWWHYGASIAFGQLLAEKGDTEGAIEALRFASWLDVHDANALGLIAGIRVRQNRLEDARVVQTQAVARQPDEPRQYKLLSEILLRMGRKAEAQVAMARIADLESLARVPVVAN